MKTLKLIASIVAAASLAQTTSAATDFGAGPTLHARALERVDHGYYNVWGSGLKEDSGFHGEFVYPSQGVRSSVELMAPIHFKYLLAFDNYKADVFERVDIVSADGTQLFVSELSWKPEEILSDDGQTLSYRMPDYAGAIDLDLVDQHIATDADEAMVQLENGYSRRLEIQKGYVTVPGWLYEQQGTFSVWKDGVLTVTDIQTGLLVPQGKEIISTKTFGVNGLETVEVDRLAVDIIGMQPQWGYNPTYEAILEDSGLFSVYGQDSWGNLPDGLWITVVGARAEAVYLKPNTDGTFDFNVVEGQTLHLKFHWSKNLKG